MSEYSNSTGSGSDYRTSGLGPARPEPQLSAAEQQQQIRQEREVLQLRQEERRLETVRRSVIITRIVRGIWFLIGALNILLGLRFFLRISGANPENTFASFIYGLSEPFVAPFSTLFVSPTSAGATNIFDINLLIAIVVYNLLGALAAWLVGVIAGSRT